MTPEEIIEKRSNLINFGIAAFVAFFAVYPVVKDYLTPETRDIASNAFWCSLFIVLVGFIFIITLSMLLFKK